MSARLYSCVALFFFILTGISYDFTVADGPEVLESNKSKYRCFKEPCRYIKTPFGITPIYDPINDPAIINLFFNEMESSKKDYIRSNEVIIIDKNFTKRGDVFYRQSLDIARSGCMKWISSNCIFNRIYFKNSCSNQHQFGSTELSECEKNNLIFTRSAVRIPNCEIKINNNENISYKEKNIHHPKNYIEYMENRFKWECRNWRN